MQRAFGLDIPQTLDEICNPTSLALVVYDMQVGILNQIANGREITERTVQVDEVKPWFLRDSPGFHLIPEMTPLPSEAIFDKIAMSAFEGTPLDIALRDCGIRAFAIVGVAMEIGIEPTVRQGADLGYIPVVVRDACGFGHGDAAERSIASLKFAGDALFTDVDAMCARFRRIRGEHPVVRQ